MPLTRTRFPSTVLKVTPEETLLKRASNNDKLGAGKSIITKGPLKGMPLFSLTLEERVTCPTSCHHWDDCFGGNLYLAKRYVHGRDLTTKLTQELKELDRKYPKGFLIRLHILGDFYSVGYVNYWRKQLEKYEYLHVFGYTARISGPIHDRLQGIRRLFPSRWVVRYSTNESFRKESPNKMYAVREDFNGSCITCPEMLDKVDACINCGLCWLNGFKKSIKFLSH